MPFLLFLISYSSRVFADFQIKLRDSLYDSLRSLFLWYFWILTKAVMVYGDDGDNNGENNGGGSLILLLLFEGIHTFFAFRNFMRRMRCSSFFFFSLRWVFCTPNSTVGYLSIFTSRFTLSFLSRFRALAPFYFLVFFFFFSFFRALIS